MSFVQIAEEIKLLVYDKGAFCLDNLVGVHSDLQRDQNHPEREWRIDLVYVDDGFRRVESLWFDVKWHAESSLAILKRYLQSAKSSSFGEEERRPASDGASELTLESLGILD